MVTDALADHRVDLADKTGVVNQDQIQDIRIACWRQAEVLKVVLVHEVDKQLRLLLLA